MSLWYWLIKGNKDFGKPIKYAEWQQCWICKGKGQVFEMDGWAAPAWLSCDNCHGTGKLKTLACGCTMVPPNIIASCYQGHGHISGQPRLEEQ